MQDSSALLSQFLVSRGCLSIEVDHGNPLSNWVEYHKQSQTFSKKKLKLYPQLPRCYLQCRGQNRENSLQKRDFN
ncbi:hypothetical protein BDR06DRAFT_127040 [Suillus hirtellus]|nr:hypothetical protein BDR06DRAFT_127040 [Suillus hirtellus]